VRGITLIEGALHVRRFDRRMLKTVAVICYVWFSVRWIATPCSNSQRTLPMIGDYSQDSKPVIASEQFMVERKKFYLDLKENARGRFYKITEDVGGRRDTIMLPAESAQEFMEALIRLFSIEKSLPPL